MPTTVFNQRVFIDTNILFYATNPGNIFGAQARHAMRRLLEDENELFISSQILREYSNATIRHGIFQKLLLSTVITDVQFNIQQFRRDFSVIYDDEAAFEKWLELLPKLTTNRDVFDFNLAATMRANGIQYLLTHNVSDFGKFADWLIMLPLFS